MKSKKVTPEQAKKYFESWRNVYRDKKIRGIDLSLLLIIKDTGYDSIFMTQSNLGELVGISRQATCRSLKNLEFQKYIIGNHPPKGSKKPVTYKLSSELVPPTKYIFFMNQRGDMSMNQSGDMKKNKSEPVMNQRGDTNGMKRKEVLTDKKNINPEISSGTQEGNKETTNANSSKQMAAVFETAKKIYPFLVLTSKVEKQIIARLKNRTVEELVSVLELMPNKQNPPDFLWMTKSDDNVTKSASFKGKRGGGYRQKSSFHDYNNLGITYQETNSNIPPKENSINEKGGDEK